MSKIIYTNGDGGVTVVVPVSGVATHNLASKLVPSGTPYSIVDDSKLPSDRDFRDAWTWAGAASGQPVIEDLAKVKEIATTRIKDIALDVITKAQQSVTLGEIPSISENSAKAGYSSYKNSISTATSVSQIKAMVSQFRITFDA